MAVLREEYWVVQMVAWKVVQWGHWKADQMADMLAVW
jgi:hypothetical protein